MVIQHSNDKISIISYIEKNDELFKNIYAKYIYELKNNIINEKILNK